MSRNFSAKKYFIYGFKKYIKNENSVLSKLYTPSLRELLNDYLEIHNDINTNTELDKLNNARNELIEAIRYFIKNGFCYEKGLYEKELTVLLGEMVEVGKGGDRERVVRYNTIYNMCNALVKKIDSDNIYLKIITFVKRTTSFIEVDKALHLMVSELVYDGYSLKYLDTWYNEEFRHLKIEESTIDNILDKFINLKRTKQKFTYYLSILDNGRFKDNKLYVDFNLLLLEQDYDSLELIDNKESNAKNYLQQKSEYKICKVEVEAMDYFKGLDIVKSSITTYDQMIHFISDDKKNSGDRSIFLEKVVCVLVDGKIIKLRLASNDTDNLFNGKERRERQDVEDFVAYRDMIFSENIKTLEIFNIQRALNIVKSQKEQSVQNRIINLWAVLEYILTFHEGYGSIISKVKDIIPKVVCLYLVKDKLNVFWSRLYEYKNNEIDIVNEMLNCKREGDEYYYDLSTLIEFIIEKGPSLIEAFNFNDNLKRDIAEIGGFLSQPEALAEYIEVKHKEISHDIVRIYRARNVLIHSGKETKSDLDLKTLRLYSYNNNLLGLIIYYMCKNPHISITEIINSIKFTYEDYVQALKAKSIRQEDICKPRYLFIG